MSKTERQRLYDSLRMRDGRKLSAHVYMKTLAEFMCARVNDRRIWTSAGVVAKQQDEREIAACVLDIGETAMTLEELNALLRQAGDETQEALEILRQSYNKVKATKELLTPQLSEMTAEVRQMRMTVERELQQTLRSLRDVREFFLASDSLTELDRLNKFIAVCKEIQSLKDAGVLDAVADLAISLAVKEGK